MDKDEQIEELLRWQERAIDIITRAKDWILKQSEEIERLQKELEKK